MKDHKVIADEVMQLIGRTLNIDVRQFSTESHITDLSEDSIQLFELLIAFERFYEVEARYEEVARLYTVADIIAYIAQKKYALQIQ